MDYINAPEPSVGGKVVSLAMPGRGKLYRCVGVSVGLLCVLQAALNVSLRLVFYKADNETPVTEPRCPNRTEECDDLLRNLLGTDQQEWIYFQSSFYYVSTTKKSWQGSRDDCLRRGADLVIVNSKQEQDFTRKFNGLRWIGLTQRGRIRVWKWVDGTPLTESFWGPGEPNSYEGRNEDCVEIKYHDMENTWNDIPCEDENFWICEKTVVL